MSKEKGQKGQPMEEILRDMFIAQLAAPPASPNIKYVKSWALIFTA